MSNARAACDLVKGFVRPGLDFRCSESSLHTDNLSLLFILIILNLTLLMQVVLSATWLCLLPLQLGFEYFQYISLN